jgi:DNA-binding CsgD family transcriptional regulator
MEPTAADLLTARELQIAVLFAQGMAAKTISRRLGTSPITVAAHLRRVYAKLGVRRRSTLAARIAGREALHRRPIESAQAAQQVLPPT